MIPPAHTDRASTCQEVDITTGAGSTEPPTIPANTRHTPAEPRSAAKGHQAMNRDRCLEQAQGGLKDGIAPKGAGTVRIIVLHTLYMEQINNGHEG